MSSLNAKARWSGNKVSLSMRQAQEKFARITVFEWKKFLCELKFAIEG